MITNMQRRSFYFSVLIVIIVIVLPSETFGAFYRNLKLGDRGEDVKELQQLLNMDIGTRVANTGYGSPGNETTYFGPLTHSAVLKLQSLYADEILTPIGLTSPTGYVGPQTRAYFDRLVLKKESGILQQDSSVQQNEIQNIGKPAINSISPKIITKISENLSIFGENFTESGNSIIISSNNPNDYTNISSGDGETINLLFKYPGADIVKRQLAGVIADGIFNEFAPTYISTLREEINGPPTSKISLYISVKNTNGQSEKFRIYVDMSAIVYEVGRTSP